MGEARRRREPAPLPPATAEALDRVCEVCRGEARKFHAALVANITRHGIPPPTAAVIVAQAMAEEGAALRLASLPAESPPGVGH